MSHGLGVLSSSGGHRVRADTSLAIPPVPLNPAPTDHSCGRVLTLPTCLLPQPAVGMGWASGEGIEPGCSLVQSIARLPVGGDALAWWPQHSSFVVSSEERVLPTSGHSGWSWAAAGAEAGEGGGEAADKLLAAGAQCPGPLPAYTQGAQPHAVAQLGAMQTAAQRAAACAVLSCPPCAVAWRCGAGGMSGLLVGGKGRRLQGASGAQSVHFSARQGLQGIGLTGHQGLPMSGANQVGMGTWLLGQCLAVDASGPCAAVVIISMGLSRERRYDGPYVVPGAALVPHNTSQGAVQKCWGEHGGD